MVVVAGSAGSKVGLLKYKLWKNHFHMQMKNIYYAHATKDDFASILPDLAKKCLYSAYSEAMIRKIQCSVHPEVMNLIIEREKYFMYVP